MKVKKIIATILACSFAASLATGFVGCVKDDDENALKINALNAGYGTAWLHALAEGYKKHNPDAEIAIDEYTGSDDKQFEDQLLAGTTADLYFGRSAMYEYVLRGNLLEDLTPLYDAKNPYDNDRTIRDKIEKDVLSDLSVGDRQYIVPWVQDALSIVYNADLFERYSLTVPNTTDELLALCEKIVKTSHDGSESQKDKDGKKHLTPFVDSEAKTSYMYIPVEVWATQYEGLDAMRGEYGFWNGYDPNGDRDVPTVLAYQGIEKSYEVLHEMVCQDNGYLHKLSMGLSFTAAQNYVIDKDFGVCMMLNGAWIQREMENSYDADEVNLKMMRMPVLSAIVEKLEYRNGGAYMTDDMLSDVIAAIDGGATTFEGVSENDMARLIEARTMMFSWSAGHAGWIPTNSDKKDVAKDFLQYMVSDEGLRIFTKATKGCTQPYDFDYLNDAATKSEMNAFMKSVYNITENSKEYFFEPGKDPLYCMGGVTLSYNWNGITMMQAFTADPSKPFNFNDFTKPGYMTAAMFAQYRLKLYEEQWKTVLSSAGLGSGRSN